MERLAKVLIDVLARSGPELALEAQVRGFWAEVAGPAVARSARPARVAGTVLWVQTVSSTWAQELSFLRENLRQRLCERLGNEAITEIRFDTGSFERLPVENEEQRFPSAASAPVEPVENDEHRFSVDDPELREAIQRARTAQARRRR